MRKKPTKSVSHSRSASHSKQTKSGNQVEKSGQSGQLFRRMASTTASAMGTPVAFCIAVLTIVIWATLGPVFNYSDTWQLVINTGTTIITFLMVFLIQNTQNRDSRALQLKLDELILTSAAHNNMVDLEDCSDEELNRLAEKFKNLRSRVHDRVNLTENEEIFPNQK